MQVAQARRETGFRGRVQDFMEDRLYTEWRWGYIFLIPTFLFFGTFTLYPVVRAVVMSFQNFTAFTTDRPFVGLLNYQLVFQTEPLFWKSILVSAIYTVGVVPPHVLIPLGLAALIYRLRPQVQTFFKSAFYIPGVAAGVTMSLAWLWILYPLESGLANQLVIWAGGTPHRWLAETDTALLSLILMSALQGWGGGIILYLAAMGGIPKSLYEAADVDCASGMAKFMNITMPLIKPTILYLIITGTIGSFQVFESAYVLTQGGPENTTTTFVYLIYRLAFMEFNFGRGAAAAVLLAFVIIAAAVFQFRWFATQVEY